MRDHDTIMEERSHRLKKLCYLYLCLANKGFEQSLLKLPRTIDPNDINYVCEIEFTEEEGTIEVEVRIDENVNSLEEADSFLVRAEGFMIQTLALYETGATCH